MSLQLPDNDSAPYFIFGKDTAGLIGAQLAPGATIKVTSSDPNTVILTQDATASGAPAGLVDPATGKPIPVGTPALASGQCSSAQPPANPNNPISVSWAVTNADGSAGPTDTDTVEVVPGLAASIGDVFGTPVAL
jgi:hypothetical protein